MMFLHALFDIPRCALLDSFLLATASVILLMNIHRGLLLAQTAVISSPSHKLQGSAVPTIRKMFRYICIPMMLLAFTTFDTKCTHPECTAPMTTLRFTHDSDDMRETDSMGKTLERIEYCGKTELKEVKTELKEVKTELKEVKTELKLKEVKTELKEVKTELKEVKTELKEVKTELKEVKTELKERDIGSLQTKILESILEGIRWCGKHIVLFISVVLRSVLGGIFLIFVLAFKKEL
jgi:hypothetical protein